jgi:hypothetical protein
MLVAREGIMGLLRDGFAWTLRRHAKRTALAQKEIEVKTT